MNIYHLDYETRSRLDIGDCGAARYSEECDVLMYAISLSDGPILLWTHPDYPRHGHGDAARDLFLRAAAEARDGKALIYAHNVDFEAFVTRYAMPEEFQVPLTAWRCTAAMCRKAASPVSLAAAGKFWLPEESQKDAAGSALIRKFSIPAEDGTFRVPTSGTSAKDRKLSADWEAFCKYCIKDVEAERALHHKLAQFELKGLDLQVFQATLRLNHRGLPIDRDAVEKAIPYVDAAMREANRRFESITGGIRTSQREQFRQWLAAQGHPFPDLQKETLREAMEVREFPDYVAEALGIYSGASFAALAKLYAMRDACMKDKRARGQFIYHGAGTGRWSATGIQPQNMRKPTVPDPDFAFSLVRAGNAEALEDFYSKPLEALASCIRNFIGDGLPMASCDFAAIEARVVCFLAEQKDALEDFRSSDRYCRMASAIYAKAYEEILALGGKSKPRQLGKVVVLGCGYGMGGPKFAATSKSWGLPLLDLRAERAVDPTFLQWLAEYNERIAQWKMKPLNIEEGLGQEIVLAFRSMHQQVVMLWSACDHAVRDAISSPGHWFSAGKFLRYRVTTLAGELYLQCELPSGRCLHYLRPRIVPDPDRANGTIVYYSQLPGTVVWGDVKLYGGLLVENATQAAAGDLMANGLITAERMGFPPFALIHDEALVSKPQALPDTLVARGKVALPEWAWGLQDALTDLPGWATGLPLDAQAEVIPYYKK